MCTSKSRSFPFVSLAVILLLLLAVTLALAEEKKKDDAASNSQQNKPAATTQPSSATNHPQVGFRRQDDNRTSVPQSQATPPGRPQPQAQPASAQPAPAPTWRQRTSPTPAPNQENNSGGGWRNRSERSDRSERGDQPNPYTRYRQQPENERTAPEANRSRVPESNRSERTAPDTGWRSGWRNRTQQPEQSAPEGQVRQRGRTRIPEASQPSEEPNRSRESGNVRGRYPYPQRNDSPGTVTPQPRSRRTRPNDGATESRGPVVSPETRGRRTNIPERNQPSDQPRTNGRSNGRGNGRVQPPMTNRTQPNQPPASRNREQIRTRVPEARFRGPEAEQRVISVPEAAKSRIPIRLRDDIKQMNPRNNNIVMRNGRISRDIVGNTVPRDARLIDLRTNKHIQIGYRRMEKHLGPATNYYTFIPRYPNDYWDGYWDGYNDGYWDGRRHLPHSAVVVNFYYNYYYSDPYWFGFSYPGYYTSVYHYYGYCPQWVYPSRVYVHPVEYVYWPNDPYRYYSRTRVDERGAERAIGDIRRAWFNNDIDLLANHLTDELDVAVYFDGEYQYTTSTEDYYGMTADALATTDTTQLDFSDPIFISSHEVFYTGRHVFSDPDGYRQTVYVSYRLRKLGGEWYIVAVGSSLDPIQHKYEDFRYN